MSRLMTKPTKGVCTQRRLRSAWAFTQSGQSSLCAHWVAKDPSFLHADSEDSDQTRWMPRLIWVFAGRTCHFVSFVMMPLILSCIDVIKAGLNLKIKCRNKIKTSRTGSVCCLSISLNLEPPQYALTRQFKAVYNWATSRANLSLGFATS